ncbi:hypothetical protein, partial [Streptomyces sp. MZ04]|uniref:hypothetical protein n=1 Tax=Streptomyces sp. MZ04 TaxID=2559236 RepID=UPI00107EA17E
MRRTDLLEMLILETGDLRPGDGTTLAELTDLRRALLDGAGGAGRLRETGTLPAMDGLLRDELDYLVGRHLATEAAPEGAVRLVRRGSPLPGDNRSAPDWAVALRPDKSFGPFLDGAGRRVWFDLFLPVERWFLVRLGAAGPVLLALPWPVGQRPDADQLTGDIPAGTVWIAAQRLAPTAPPHAWAGLRVVGGVIDVDGAAQFTPGQLAVSHNTRVTLTLDLDPGSSAGTDTGPDTGAGAEAARSVCDMPRTVVLLLDPDGPGTVGELTASLSVFGDRIDLRRQAGAAAPRYHAALRHILVPLAPTPGRIHIAGDTRAGLFTPSGAAEISHADWALPVTTGTTDSLGEGAGVG